eukprot:TRINITY_DN0_c103_g1_i1.p1 TRINITY_DN0_c103_g1~~TRINITY_DN0_c103_g1_i1.p1  ORF type:complete len:196 (+),score=34.46 TRINITY_DN0_c103_g1_i1:33-590(+)
MAHCFFKPTCERPGVILYAYYTSCKPSHMTVSIQQQELINGKCEKSFDENSYEMSWTGGCMADSFDDPCAYIRERQSCKIDKRCHWVTKSYPKRCEATKHYRQLKTYFSEHRKPPSRVVGEETLIDRRNLAYNRCESIHDESYCSNQKDCIWQEEFWPPGCETKQALEEQKKKEKVPNVDVGPLV